MLVYKWCRRQFSGNPTKLGINGWLMDQQTQQTHHGISGWHLPADGFFLFEGHPSQYWSVLLVKNANHCPLPVLKLEANHWEDYLHTVQIGGVTHIAPEKTVLHPSNQLRFNKFTVYWLTSPCIYVALPWIHVSVVIHQLISNDSTWSTIIHYDEANYD